MPTRKIFASRWWALVWAVGICWTAVELADGQHADDSAAPANAATANADAAADAAAVNDALKALSAQ